MYVFLLILGAVIAAAGVVLIGPGLPFGGRDYDASIVTPGAVAIVGGLILIGLALAVRVLGRIEKALAARPLPQPVLQEEAAAPATEEPAAAAPARLPFPPKPAPQPVPSPAPAVATARVLPEDAALERLREKFPTLVRLENAPVVEDADVSLSPKPSVRADEAVAEANNAVAQQTNGAAPARIEPRLEVQARPASRPERAKNFEAFWPKKQRPGQEAPAPAAQQSAAQQPPALPVEPVLTPEPVQFQFREPAPEPRPVAPAPEAPTMVSILKSGVVDGMAYTLYSDGSIEAQLPQGTLRFGSITELRNHIEQSA
ncbi:MAG: hypothetical protein WB764_15265 [Xanthobacteraceae bacterium]